jgi:hypothetical protein
MASTTQIVPKFSFPYVDTYINDYTQVTNEAESVYADPACNYIFVFRSSKGIDNVFVKKNTAESFKTLYGDSNYKKYGQPLMMPLAALASPHATGWCMRVMPENATYSHKVVNIHYYPDAKNRKFYIKLVGADAGSENAISTTTALAEFAKSTIPESKVDPEGFNVRSFATLRSAGRGTYGDNYCVRATSNSSYEKEYGLKMYTYGIASKEGNYKSVASYVGANTTTTKYTENTFINDILDDTDPGVAPVIITIDEDSITDVYDAYLDFCNQMADEVIPQAVATALDAMEKARTAYNDLATPFTSKYGVAVADVVGDNATIPVPAELSALKVALEEATANGVPDDIDAAQKAFDDYQTSYVSDVADLQEAYNTFAAARDEYNLVIYEQQSSNTDELPDLDEFDFLFGQKVSSTDSYPFIEFVTDKSAVRAGDVKPGEVTGTVDVSTLGSNVVTTTDTIDSYVAAYDGSTGAYLTIDEHTTAPTSADEAVKAGADDYVIDASNKVYVVYVDVETDSENPESTTKTMKYFELGTKQEIAEATKEADIPLVGDEELVDFGSTVGIQLVGGSDGYFDKPRTTESIEVTANGTQIVKKEWTVEEEEALCYQNAFNGTYDRRVLTARRINADAIFDANYPFEVKRTLAELTLLRNDAPLYLDTGIISSYTTETVSALVNKYSIFDSYLISKNLQHYKVKEPSTSKRVTVTITYFLAQIHGNHYQNIGFEIPMVKGYAQLSGHINNSLEPTIEDFETDLKETLYNNRFNYFETVDDNVYQRATQQTSQSIESDLSEESNVQTAYTIKRGVERILNDDLYDFSDSDERSRLKKIIDAKYQSYIGSKVKSLDIDFAVSDWENEHSIIHCYLSIVFRALGKRAILEIDINKRDNSTDSSTSVLTSES